MVVKFEPLKERILIEPIKDELKKTAGGLIVPDSAIPKGSTEKCKVVKVGKGLINKDGKRVPINVKPGDVVLTNRFDGAEIKIEKKTYRVISEVSIIGIYDEEEGKN
jgi:chaperonin GroES